MALPRNLNFTEQAAGKFQSILSQGLNRLFCYIAHQISHQILLRITVFFQSHGGDLAQGNSSNSYCNPFLFAGIAACSLFSFHFFHFFSFINRPRPIRVWVRYVPWVSYDYLYHINYQFIHQMLRDALLSTGHSAKDEVHNDEQKQNQPMWLGGRERSYHILVSYFSLWYLLH